MLKSEPSSVKNFPSKSAFVSTKTDKKRLRPVELRSRPDYSTFLQYFWNQKHTDELVGKQLFLVRAPSTPKGSKKSICLSKNKAQKIDHTQDHILSVIRKEDSCRVYFVSGLCRAQRVDVVLQAIRQLVNNKLFEGPMFGPENQAEAKN